MALFDFLKKKEHVEKNEERKKARRVSDTQTVLEEKPKTKQKKAKTEETVASVNLSGISGMFALIAPHITERARMLSEQGQYSFRVNPKATKYQIKDAIEKTYNVHVEHVQVTKVHEKLRRRGLTEGVKKGYKKAVVALRKGEAIDIF